MKINVAVEVPLPSKNETFTLQPPCTYCGEQRSAEPGASLVKLTETYNLRHWGAGMYGNAECVFVKTKNGSIQEGRATVIAPYCAEHAKILKRFNPPIFISVVVILTLILCTWAYISTGGLLGVSILMGLCGLILTVPLGFLINNLIFRIMHKTGDYPGVAAGKGHWGLTIFHREDQGKFKVGPVRYFLEIRFLNIKSAQRFLAAYPSAKIIKGEQLIKE
jgi:hypothetical protein